MIGLSLNGGLGGGGAVMGWRWYGAVGLAGTLVYLWLPEWAQNVWYDVLSVSVVVALLIGANRSRGTTRTAWLLFAGAQACYGAADIAWGTVNARYGSVPVPSLIDVAYLAYYPLAAVALVLLLRRRGALRQLDAALDALIVGAALGMVTWVVLHPLITTSDLSAAARVINLIYPVADVVLLVLAVRLAFESGPRSLSFRLLLVSIALTSVADLLFLVGTWRGTFISGGVVDLGWLLAYVAFGVAALHPSQARLGDPHGRQVPLLRRRRVGLLAAVGLVPAVTVVLGAALGERLEVGILVVTSSVLYLLVLARVVGVVRTQERTIQRERILRQTGERLVAARGRGDVERIAVAAAADLAGARYQVGVAPALGPEGVGPGPELERLVVPLNSDGLGALVVTGPLPMDASTRWGIETLASQVALANEAITLDRERERSERRFKSIVYTSSDLMFVTRPDGVITWCAESVRPICGYRPEQLLGVNMRTYVHPEDAEVLENFARVVRRSEGAARSDCRIRMADGSYKTFQVTGRNLLDDEAVRGLVWTGLDVTERRALEHQMRGRAFHDLLTGLPNRALFADRLEHAFAAAGGRADPHGGVAVLFIDLDDFKRVNDSLGHQAGDELLVLVAHRISGLLRASDTAARFGGDEFAVLLEEVTEAEAGIVAERILAALSAPFDVADREVYVRASIGVALDDGTSDVHAILRNADIAMYRAKASGKGRQEPFRLDMHEDAVRRLELHGDLQRAFERNEFVVYYQPIVELTTARVVGFEALVRWEHPTQGLLGPGDFIALAEETGLITPLGQWVLDRAGRQLGEWQRRFDPTLTMAVNISARQLAPGGDLRADVTRALDRSGIDPATLTLELTENALVSDVDATTRTLTGLRALGVRIAIDDFGTGYSSLSYLERFPIDVLKVDRTFVLGLLDPTRSPTLVSMIIELARSLGATTIAEGIEEREQQRRLRDLGCPMGQGFLFARPLAAAVLERMLTSGELSRHALVATAAAR